MTEATSIVGAVNPIEVLETGFEHSRIEHGGLEADQTEMFWSTDVSRRRQKEIPETAFNELASDGSGSGRIAPPPRCVD